MKQVPREQSEDTPISNPEEYNQNLEKIALSMLTKGSIKHKVRDFKSRVFGLLIIYLQKIKSVSILIQALIPVFNQIQPVDIPKLDALLREALKKSNTIQIPQLKSISEHYQKLLVKTARWKDSKKITQTFSLILKSLMQHGISEEQIKGIIIGLQQKYIYKRGVKIHPQTLQYLLKKFRFVKDSFLDNLQKAVSSQNLREAMKKQAKKMLRWFGKSSSQIKLQ